MSKEQESSVAYIDLCVGYSGKVILRNITLEVPKGSFLPIVGPNGSGKSSLLKTTLGLIKPLSGVVRYSSENRPIGYVAQESSILNYFPVTALELVEMGFFFKNELKDKMRGFLGFLRLNGRKNVWREEALNLLDDMDLLEHAKKSFWELSGGMRQKVLIARALALDPDILVMDEPTADLDSISQERVINALHHASVHSGKTVLFVHHGLDHLEGLAGEVCLVRNQSALLMPLKEAKF